MKHPNLVIERIDVTDTKMIRGVAAKYERSAARRAHQQRGGVEQTFQADLEKVNIPYDKIDFDAARNDFDVNTLKGPCAWRRPSCRTSRSRSRRSW